MDLFNNDWKEYVGREDKVLAHSAIKPAVYWLTSFFKTVGTLFFLSLFSFWIIAFAAGVTADKKESAVTTITIDDGKGGVKNVAVQNRPESESVAEAVQRSEARAQKGRAIRRFVFSTLAAMYALIWIIWGLHYKSYKYVVTSRGVYEIGGMLFKHAKFIMYAKITDTILKRNVLDLIFGTATIGVSTPGGTRSSSGNSQPYEARFKHVPDYKKLRDLINKSLK